MVVQDLLFPPWIAAQGFSSRTISTSARFASSFHLNRFALEGVLPAEEGDVGEEDTVLMMG
jgi:hypothetical protein